MHMSSFCVVTVPPAIRRRRLSRHMWEHPRPPCPPPARPTEYGRYWCWCFWEQEIDVSAMWSLEQPELLCRAWDAAMNRQPETITWNVMGMMNNSYFRIKVHRTLDASGRPALKFQHPTLAGPGNFTC